MTTTALPRQSAAGRERLPAPPRDRRPALAALALLLVLGGALGSALIAYRSGDRIDVLVARSDVQVGQVMGRDDFTVARVAADNDNVIDSAALDAFVGTTALGRIPAGTLLNNAMFQAGGAGVVPGGAVVVGVVLTAQQRPAGELRQGDVVRVFLVPNEASGSTVGTVLASAVRVAEPPVPAGGDQVRLSLLVPESNASAVVGAAATGSLALTRLASDAEPSIDFAAPEQR